MTLVDLIFTILYDGKCLVKFGDNNQRASAQRTRFSSMTKLKMKP